MFEQGEQERRQEEARNPATHLQRLETLCTDSALRILVAGNPAAPLHLLEILAQDQDEVVRQAVASNPNTPWKTLEELAWEFPKEFLHNPAGSLQMLAHPEHICTNKLFWDALLRTAPIPSLWWNWLRSHPILSGSQAMRLHVQYAGELVSFNDPFQENEAFTLMHLLLEASRQGVSLLPQKGESFVQMQLLTADVDLEAPMAVFANTLFPDHAETTGEELLKEHLRRLAGHVDPLVRQAAAHHPYMPVEMLAALAQDQDARVRWEVARNKQTPTEVLFILAQDQDWEVREVVAWHARIPEVLQILAQDPNWQVRTAVAEGEWTPAELLCTLAQDSFIDFSSDNEAPVLCAVASNRHTPVEALLALTQKRDNYVKDNAEETLLHLQMQALGTFNGTEFRTAGRRRLAENGYSTSSEVLQTLARDDDVGVRRAVARNKHTPMEALLTLALDQDEEVRRAVLENEHVPVKALYTLAQDLSPWVRKWVARNKSTPVEIVYKLAQDPKAGVREAIAWNGLTPLEIVCKLAQDPEAQVRSAVAWNESTPLEIVYKLAQDPEAQVREAVATKKRISTTAQHILAWDRKPEVRQMVASRGQDPGVLQILAQDADAVVRRRIAWNPCTPVDVLRVLAQDLNIDVRTGVGRNKQTPAELLRTLAHDQEQAVRQAVAEHPQAPLDILHLLTHDQKEEVRWWAKLGRMLLAENGSNWWSEEWRNWASQLRTRPAMEQLDWVARRDMEQSLRRTIIATLAASWKPSEMWFSVRISDEWNHILAPFMPPLALQKLSSSPSWEVRSLVALHKQTSTETRQHLSQDGNRYVRAIARAKQEN